MSKIFITEAGIKGNEPSKDRDIEINGIRMREQKNERYIDVSLSFIYVGDMTLSAKVINTKVLSALMERLKDIEL